MVYYSIIIPTYNRESELENLLTILTKQIIENPQGEVIITYDGELNSEIINKFSNLNFIKGPNKGPAANRNHAAYHAQGIWLIFIDDDCIPSSTWLYNALKTAKTTSAECIEGKTISNQIKSRFDEVAPINLDGGKLWSCNFAIKKEKFQSLSGFDTAFPIATMEDIDFKLRYERVGRIHFERDMEVIHPWRKKKPFVNFKARVASQKYFLRKNPPSSIAAYRFNRTKIFVTGIPLSLLQLLNYKGKGWIFFFDKMAMNFCLIFI